MIRPNASLPRADDDHHRSSAASSFATNERVLKCGDTFGVFDRHGDVGLEHAPQEGVFHAGTRFLRQFGLTIGGGRPLLLGSAVREHNVLLAIDLTNPPLYRGGKVVVPQGTLNVVRHRLMRQGAFHERIVLTNYGHVPVEFDVEITFESDFVDVFEVRGMDRERRGDMLQTEVTEQQARIRYRGLDDVLRCTRLCFHTTPNSIESTRAGYRIALRPQESRELELTVHCEQAGESFEVLDYSQAHREALEEIRSVKASIAAIDSKHEYFQRWLQRSRDDLVMMLSRTRWGLYPYAGVPWYNTPFGRDGLLTALEALWVQPEIGASVLRFLAAHQASSHDEAADAEPGKIVHEMRRGEMAALREIPFGRYYGTVDATPLFVLLAGRYWTATGDHATLAALWPALCAAMKWIDDYGDLDGDGFIEYARHSANGLLQQGWKDSDDSVFHADGNDARGPIALCEVQGYVYGAKQAMASIAAALGHDEDARRWCEQAEELRERFDRAFWCDEIGTYALALDGDKRPCRVRTSNAGHCLFTGIALPARASILAHTLLSDDMFSGWGIRTLSTREARYNPISYHNGSVWPHDNAVIARGLAAYGRKAEASRVMMGLFDAACDIDLQRLPELFCGFHRREHEGPTLYPSACAPQAWAAAAPFMLLEASLGITVEGARGRVLFENPTLPEEIDEIRLQNLRVGRAEVDLALIRYPTDVGINVTRRVGEIQVVAIK